MATITTNTTITLPAGQMLVFGLGGSATAIIDGNVYELGLGEKFFGPFTANESVQVVVRSGTITYNVETDGAASREVTQNPITRQLVPDALDSVLGAVGSPYLGQVATNCSLNNWTNSVNKQMMSRTRHIARDRLTSVQVAYGNWRVNTGTGAEEGNGSTAQVTMSIEYPVGTYTRVTFGGQTTGTAGDAATIISDSTPVDIPAGAVFFVRLWTNNANGLIYADNHKARTGEMNAFGVTTADLTMGGDFAAATAIMQVPVAIIGQTVRPSFFLAGTSRTKGISDTADNSGDVGVLARSIGSARAYINAGIASDAVVDAKSNYTRRMALSAYCTHVICEYGINDVRGNAKNRTAAQIVADLNTFAALFNGKPFYQTTCPPYTSSTDSFATTANQSTAVNTNHAQLVALNDSIRAGNVNAHGVIDLARITAPTGVWEPYYTTDGLHEVRRGALAIQSASVLHAGMFG
jgi:hypothetical protein